MLDSKDVTVDSSLRSYLLEISKVLRDPTHDALSSEESKEILLSNVYKEIIGHEIALSIDKKCSKVMEMILNVSNTIQLVTFFGKLKGRYVPMMEDCYGSHVFEKLLSTLASSHMIAYKEGKKNSSIVSEILISFENDFLQLCEKILEEKPHLGRYLQEMISHRYASHVLRCILNTLAGKPREEAKARSRTRKFGEFSVVLNGGNQRGKASTTNDKTFSFVPEIFKETFYQFQEAIFSLDIGHLSFDTFANPVLQLLLELTEHRASIIEKTLFLVSHRQDKVESVNGDNDNSGKTRMNKSQVDSHINAMIRHPVGSHFVEKALRFGGQDFYIRLYNGYYRHRLYSLSQHQIANWTVQQMIHNATHPAQVEMIFDELQEHIGDLIEAGRIGVVANMTQAIQCFNVRQKELVKCLNDKCVPKDSGSTLVSSLLSMNSDRKSGSRFSLPACMIVESLFSFQTTIAKRILEGFASLEIQQLVKLAKDPIGSRVIEAFLISSFDAHKKQLFIDKWKGTFVDISCNKYGAFCVEKMYQLSEISRKETMASELISALPEVANNPYLQLVIGSCRLGALRTGKKEAWMEQETQNENKRKLFAELLEDTEANSIVDEQSISTQLESNNDHENTSLDKRKKVSRKINDINIGNIVENNVTDAEEIEKILFGHRESNPIIGRKRPIVSERIELTDAFRDEESLSFILETLSSDSSEKRTIKAKKKK